MTLSDDEHEMLQLFYGYGLEIMEDLSTGETTITRGTSILKTYGR